MYYHSTQDKSKSVLSAQAIAQGISQDGGLFVPESFPQLSADELRSMLSMSYQDRAKLIVSKYLTDFSAEEISDCVDSAYRLQIPNVQPIHWSKQQQPQHHTIDNPSHF